MVRRNVSVLLIVPSWVSVWVGLMNLLGKIWKGVGGCPGLQARKRHVSLHLRKLCHDVNVLFCHSLSGGWLQSASPPLEKRGFLSSQQGSARCPYAEMPFCFINSPVSVGFLHAGLGCFFTCYLSQSAVVGSLHDSPRLGGPALTFRAGGVVLGQKLHFGRLLVH